MTDGLRVIRAVAQHAVRTTPGSPPRALERRNRIDERQRFGSSHVDWHRSCGRRAASPARRRSPAFAPALGTVGRIRTNLRPTTHGPHGTAIHHRPRPINLGAAGQPIQQREMNEIPNAGALPVAQASPARHPRTAAEFLRQHLPWDALRTTKRMPVRHARSGTRGLPPFGRRGGIGRNGSTRSHNASGSSVEAITGHVTLPKK